MEEDDPFTITIERIERVTHPELGPVVAVSFHLVLRALVVDFPVFLNVSMDDADLVGEARSVLAKMLMQLSRQTTNWVAQ